MRHERIVSIVGLLAISLCSIAGAADFTNEFLREARDRGYGRVMVEYLTTLNESSRLPSELKETFDLEMSKALRVAALNDAFNKEEREKWQNESKERLEKFLKEKPDHPEVASAQSTFGDLAFERGIGQIRQSRGTQDKALKTKHLTEARKAFDEARPRFTDAASRFEKRFEEMQAALEELKAVKGTPQGRIKKAESMTEDTLFDWLDNRSKVGRTEFYFAQTFEDPKDKARSEALDKAARQFDEIYQDNRESPIGMEAHAWHGKAVDEKGDFELATDIYEEVLANVDPNPNIQSGLEGLFAQVFYFRALLEIKKGNVAEFVKTAPEWLQTYKPWRKFDGYQGINLEYAKALLAQAEKAPAEVKGKMQQTAVTILKAMKLVPGEFQNDAIYALRGLGKEIGEDNATEAMALAEEAAKSANWDDAEKNYNQALELATNSKKANEKKLIPEIEAALDQVRYRLAIVKYSEGKYDEVLKACNTLVKNKSSNTAPQAAALAVQACLMFYIGAGDPAAKEKALDRLNKAADFTIKNWPDKAEADDARIAMGQAKQVQGGAALGTGDGEGAKARFEEAIQVFEDVNPRSERYGNGLYLAGQTHWRIYTQLKEKVDPAKGPARAKKAEDNLTKAVAFLRKKRDEKPNDPPPNELNDAQLLLGELFVDVGKGGQAVELLEPQVTAIIAEKPKEASNETLRTFLAAVRAYMAAGDLKKAGDTSLALMEFAPDQAQTNKILVTFMTLMQLEWQKASAAEIEAKSGDDLSAKDSAAALLAATSEPLGKMIEKLKDRKEMDVKPQLFMAQAATEIGRKDLAEPLYNALLQKLEALDDSDPQKKAIPHIRSSLIGIVREKKDYKTALEQVDKLLESNPNVLSFMMERGRILQAWAETDESKFEPAVQQWVDVRSKLQNQKTKPPEFYEVNYNAAYCLWVEATKKKDPKKLQDAAKLLNAMLFMNPKLNGPKMVAQYYDLLKKVDPEGYKKRMEDEKKKAKEEKDKAKTAATK